MAVYNAIYCVTGLQVVVDVNDPVNPGDVFFVSDGTRLGSYCVTIDSLSIDRPTLTGVTAPYTDCLDCLTGNSITISFANCDTVTKITIDSQTLKFLPDSKSFYSITYTDKFGDEFTSCFSRPGQRQGIVANSTYISSVEYASCELCSFSANNTSFIVEDCIYRNTYIVFAPTTTLPGQVISFIPDGTLDQICGIVVEPSTDPYDSIFLSYFNRCEDCLDQVTSKRELISCIDGTIEIVYSSALYNVGETGYLTISDPNEGFSGCYRIGDISTDPVTATAYLSYGPSPSCDECVACQSFEFEYFLCSDENITGSTFSNQYIEIGQSFYHPLSGCCEVSGYLTGETSLETFRSFYEFTNCTECTGSTSNNEYEVWVGEHCAGQDQVIVVVPLGATSGNTYQSNLGILTNDCVKLIEPYTSQEIFTFTKTTEISYNDCEPCLSNTFTAIPFVKCGEGTSTFFSISLSDYLRISENRGGIFTDGSYNCYYALQNGCATDNYPRFIPNNFFSSFFECNQPLSAGTESTICQICCPCTTGESITSVDPPHPQWTNQQGKTIILLDAITLGGPNGLNN